MAKGRDSGMPAAELWESYFNAGGVLDAFGFRDVTASAPPSSVCLGHRIEVLYRHILASSW